MGGVGGGGGVRFWSRGGSAEAAGAGRRGVEAVGGAGLRGWGGVVTGLVGTQLTGTFRTGPFEHREIRFNRDGYLFVQNVLHKSAKWCTRCTMCLQKFPFTRPATTFARQ